MIMTCVGVLTVKGTFLGLKKLDSWVGKLHTRHNHIDTTFFENIFFYNLDLKSNGYFLSSFSPIMHYYAFFFKTII